MGYDLHITRKRHWSDPGGPTIGEPEWRRVIDDDPELRLDTDTRCTMAAGEYVFASWRGVAGALGYYNGEITAKNPDAALVVKMVGIADALGAFVQGDDGEIYRPDGTSFHREADAPPHKRGWVERVRARFRTRRDARELRQGEPALRVGSRVRNVFGDTGTVLEVDSHANGGLGRVRVRLDDGREQAVALGASGLEPEDGSAGDDSTSTGN